MSRKQVGYFEGTDSRLLSALVCDGHDTIPISNGLDNHGKHIRLMNEENKVDVLVGYIHKVYAPEGAETCFQDIVHICQTYDIPLILEVYRDNQACAREKLGEPSDIVRFVDPDDMLEALREILVDS
jgi:hypothetical protein